MEKTVRPASGRTTRHFAALLAPLLVCACTTAAHPRGAPEQAPSVQAEPAAPVQDEVERAARIEFHLDLVQRYVAAGRYEDALDSADDALALIPGERRPELWDRISAALGARTEPAPRPMETAAAPGPAPEHPTEPGEDTDESATTHPDETPPGPRVEALEQAAAYSRDGQVDEAVAAYEAILEDPAAVSSHAEVRGRLLELWRQDGVLEDRVAELEARRAVDPTNVAILETLAQAYASGGSEDDAVRAVAVAEDLVLLAPLDPDRLQDLATRCERAGRPERAAEICKQLFMDASLPEHYRHGALRSLWNLWKVSGVWQERLAELREAALADPTDRGALLLLDALYEGPCQNPYHRDEALVDAVAAKAGALRAKEAEDIATRASLYERLLETYAAEGRTKELLDLCREIREQAFPPALQDRAGRVLTDILVEKHRREIEARGHDREVLRRVQECLENGDTTEARKLCEVLIQVTPLEESRTRARAILEQIGR